MSKQKFGLGRGLGSLIPTPPAKIKNEVNNEAPRGQEGPEYFSSRTFDHSAPDPAVAGSMILDVSPGVIISNRHQPRRMFETKALRELSDSIREHGILQPLVAVKRDDGKAGYELVAGERRLRAATMAGLKTVPVIVREYDELERLELAMIENIQRADLNPMEEAFAYQKLNDEFGLTHEQIAKRIGKSRPGVSNCLRFLTLAPEMQEALAQGEISEGHAKVLLEIKDESKRKEIFKKILADKLTIADASHEVRRVNVGPHQRKTAGRDPNLDEYESRLREYLGTKVSIRKRGQEAGVIWIDYYGEEEFGELMKKLTGG